MPEPVRVLHMLPDLRVGGGQELLLRNIGALDRSRISSCVCAVSPHGDMEPRFSRAGFQIVHLGTQQARDLPRAAARIARTVKKLGIDIVHTNNTGPDKLLGQIGALAAGIPVVNTIHSDFERDARRGLARSLLQGGRRAVERQLSRLTVHHTVAVSGRALESWSPYLRSVGIGPDRATVLHAGLDLEAFTSDTVQAAASDLKRELGLSDLGPILINVARLVPGKGQRWLLEMMETVAQHRPGARLLLVGAGPDREGLEALAKSRGLSGAVRFLGARDDVPALLAMADLFVFPSQSEGFGLAPLEAMAAALPVVAFRLPALEEFIDDNPVTGSGVLVPRQDASQMTRTVLELLDHPDRMRAMGRAGREIVRTRFSLAQTAAELERIYLSVAGREAPRPRTRPVAASLDPARVS